MKQWLFMLSPAIFGIVMFFALVLWGRQPHSMTEYDRLRDRVNALEHRIESLEAQAYGVSPPKENR